MHTYVSVFECAIISENETVLPQHVCKLSMCVNVCGVDTQSCVMCCLSMKLYLKKTGGGTVYNILYKFCYRVILLLL